METDYRNLLNIKEDKRENPKNTLNVWVDAAFCHHITDNYDIEDLCNIISDNDFMAYSDWGDCHTLCNMEITYYDDNGTPFLVTFDDIIEQFKEMSYEEICDFINSIIDEDNEDEEDY